jgi:hypothetical protein
MAQKRHPKPKDFDKFIKPVVGLGRSRAYDLIRLAGGRTTEAQLRKDQRERQAKSRANKKKKSPPQLPPPAEPQPAATFRDVTETAEPPAADTSASLSKNTIAAARDALANSPEK